MQAILQFYDGYCSWKAIIPVWWIFEKKINNHFSSMAS